MKTKILEKFPEMVILDLRGFRADQPLVKKSVWFGIPGLQYGWVAALMDKQKQYGVYVDQIHFKNRQFILQAFREQSFLNIVDVFTQKSVDFTDVDQYLPKIANSIQQNDHIIIDVRTPQEWDQYGYINTPNTLRIQLKSLFENIDQVDKTHKYLPHCKAGYRSQIAYSWLVYSGIDSMVYNKSWQQILEEGVPIKKKSV